MDIVINEDDAKSIVQKSLEAQGYTVELITMGLDPNLTAVGPNMMRHMGMGPNQFDQNNPNRPKLAFFVKVNKNESNNQTNS